MENLKNYRVFLDKKRLLHLWIQFMIYFEGGDFSLKFIEISQQIISQ